MLFTNMAVSNRILEVTYTVKSVNVASSNFSETIMETETPISAVITNGEGTTNNLLKKSSAYDFFNTENWYYTPRGTETYISKTITYYSSSGGHYIYQFQIYSNKIIYSIYDRSGKISTPSSVPGTYAMFAILAS